MYSTSEFKKGLKILHKKEPFEIIEVDYHKPGKGASVVRTKLKSLLVDQTISFTFRAGDKVDKANISEREARFLYNQNDLYYFIDTKNYEQFEVKLDIIGDASSFLIEDLEVSVLFFENKAVSIELPKNVILEVMACDPSVRGDTVSGATKTAKLSTGHMCQVPLFINEKDKIKISTKNGNYVERA